MVGVPSFLLSQVFPNLPPRNEPQPSHKLGNRCCFLGAAQAFQPLVHNRQPGLSSLGPRNPREAGGQMDALPHSQEACSHLSNFSHPASSLTWNMGRGGGDQSQGHPELASLWTRTPIPSDLPQKTTGVTIRGYI